MTERATRVAVISAVRAAMQPAAEAILRELPAATIWNLLDDRLQDDAVDAGGVTPDLADRIERLIALAVCGGADAVLLSCSMFGDVARRPDCTIPVLGADHAAFDDLAAAAYDRLLVVSPNWMSLEDSLARLDAYLRAAGVDTDLSGAVVDIAMATPSGDARKRLLRATTDGLRARTAHVDAVFLAQFSLSPLGEDLSAATGRPVVASAASAARRLAGYVG